jgi:hypothetical protein
MFAGSKEALDRGKYFLPQAQQNSPLHVATVDQHDKDCADYTTSIPF